MRNVIGGRNSTTFLGSTTYKVSPTNTNEVGSTSVNLLSKGLSILSYSTSGKTYTLGVPDIGEEKVLFLNNDTLDTTIPTVIQTSSTNITINDYSTNPNKRYINVLPPYSTVKLIGLSSSQWGIISGYGITQFSTGTDIDQSKINEAEKKALTYSLAFG